MTALFRYQHKLAISQSRRGSTNGDTPGIAGFSFHNDQALPAKSNPVVRREGSHVGWITVVGSHQLARSLNGEMNRDIGIRYRATLSVGHRESDKGEILPVSGNLPSVCYQLQ